MTSVPADGRSYLQRRRWLTAGAPIYVVGVAAIAAAGFVTDSTSTILLAALLGLPASVVAVPGYYLLYGMLALVPGANPSSGSGTLTCAPDGTCHGSVTGEPAAWFLITADAIGILALTCAALLNVIAIGLLTATLHRRRSVAADPGR